MDAGVIALMIPIVAIISGTVLKVARLRAAEGSPAALTDLKTRFEALEHEMHEMRGQLDETLERLDFTERLLSKAREEKRIG